jgi:hypothetical protein
MLHSRCGHAGLLFSTRSIEEACRAMVPKTVRTEPRTARARNAGFSNHRAVCTKTAAATVPGVSSGWRRWTTVMPLCQHLPSTGSPLLFYLLKLLATYGLVKICLSNSLRRILLTSLQNRASDRSQLLLGVTTMLDDIEKFRLIMTCATILAVILCAILGHLA